MPDEEWIFTIQEPVNDFSYSYIDTEGNLNFYCDSRYDELLFYDEYDEKGNLLTSHNKEDIYNSTIYCYNNSKPVAGIQNAYNVDRQEGVSCGFLNFESGCTDNIPDNNFWQIGNDGQIYDLDAHTGKYSCIISKSRAAWSTLRVFYPMEQDEKFIFSAWVKSLDGYIDDQGGIGYELYNINDELISSSWHWINFKDTH